MAPSVTSLAGQTLSGRFVALEPLEPRHHDGLIAAAADANINIWAYMPVADAAGFAAKLGWLAQEAAHGAMVPFAVRRLSDSKIIGFTSYLAIAPEHGRVEIGWTWYGADARGTQVNPEAKLLLLAHAFAAGYHRVEFKTCARNLRSRAALAKLGATQDGILRGHMWMPPGPGREGYFRDSVYFAILAPEWPGVRAGLEKRL